MTDFRSVTPPSRQTASPPASRPPADEGQAESGTFPRERLRVLIIDDEPLVLRSWARSLRAFDVSTAESLEAAISRISDEPHAFDVIVSDLLLGDGTGVELHRWLIRELGASAPPLLVLTGGAAEEDASYLAETRVPYALKPITLRVLRETIVSLAARRPTAGRRVG